MFERFILILHTTHNATKTIAIARMITISTESTGTPATSARFSVTGGSVGGGGVVGGGGEAEGGGEVGGGGGGEDVGGGTAGAGGTRED